MTIVLLDNNTTNCRKAAMNEKKNRIFKKRPYETYRAFSQNYHNA